MFKNIVVPIDVDHPDEAEALLGRAKALVEADGRVTVVYVVEDVPGLFTEALPDGFAESAAGSARSKLEQLLKTSGMQAEIQVRMGRPFNAIVGLADEMGADLIMLRSHRPGVQHYLLGSTAANVVRQAKCAVLVER